MIKYFVFLEKILEDYNKNHKILLSKKYSSPVYELSEYLRERYKNIIDIEILYLGLFDRYETSIWRGFWLYDHKIPVRREKIYE